MKRASIVPLVVFLCLGCSTPIYDEKYRAPFAYTDFEERGGVVHVVETKINDKPSWGVNNQRFAFLVNERADDICFVAGLYGGNAQYSGHDYWIWGTAFLELDGAYLSSPRVRDRETLLGDDIMGSEFGIFYEPEFDHLRLAPGEGVWVILRDDTVPKTVRGWNWRYYQLFAPYCDAIGAPQYITHSDELVPLVADIERGHGHRSGWSPDARIPTSLAPTERDRITIYNTPGVLFVAKVLVR